MHLFATHFGTYEVTQGREGPLLQPFRHDTAPSPVGQHYLDLADHPDRVRGAWVRRGWRRGDGGVARGQDVYDPVPLDEAASLAAQELTRIRAEHGNESLFGGSYGWASAGRFHHAQSQLKRFLTLAGGFVSARNTYSYGTAKVLLPHLVGPEYADPGFLNPTWDRILAVRPFVLSFGGMRLANAQVEAGGTGDHRTAGYIAAFERAGGRMLTLSPDARDAPMGDHLGIHAGTDVHAMLAMAHVLLTGGHVDAAAVHRIASGFDAFRDLVLGTQDGQPKTPEWAAPITGIAPERLRALALRLVEGPALINLAWSLQRAHAGEQPYWAAIALATISGQIGRPGCGIACGLSAVSSIGNPLQRLKGPAFDQGQNPVRTFIPVARITEMLERPGAWLSYDGMDIRLPDIRLIWWAGGNPFHHHQDLNRLARAWRRPETVIVHESVWTATARHADIVFPSALPFERDDVAAASRDDWIIHSRRVMDPPEGVETDHQILTRIAARMGLDQAFTGGRSVDDWLRHLYEGYRDSYPVLPEWQAFCAAGHAKLPDPADPAALIQPLEAFVADPQGAPLSTPGGRIALMPPGMTGPDAVLGAPLVAPRAADQGPDAALPLRLLSPQPEQRLHSQLDGARTARAARVEGYEVARLNPRDLAEAGVPDRTVADLENDRGRVRILALADDRVLAGHVVLPTGGWYRPQRMADGVCVDMGGNPNTLTRDAGASALSQGAAAGGARVRLRRP